MKHFSVLILFDILYLYFSINVPCEGFSTLQVIGVVGLAQLIYSLWSWYRSGKEMLSPFVFFLISLYIFSCGQVLLYPFNLFAQLDLINHRHFSEADIYDASLVSLFFLNVFQIGALISIKKSRNVVVKEDLSYDKLKRVGWFLFLVSFYFYYRHLIETAIISLTLGYTAIYDNVQYGLAHLSSFFVQLYIPALICLYIAYHKDKLWNRIITCIFLFNVLLYFVIGGRSAGVTILMMLVILHHYLIKPISGVKLLGVLAGGVLLLSVLSWIQTSRGSTDRLNAFQQSQTENSSNAAVNAIGDMGTTMDCYIWTKEEVPAKEDFRYGRSYLYAFFAIVPNLNFWKEHPSKKEANLSEWLMDTKGLLFGPGFSMVAEAYINFGIWGGWIIFFIWGFFMAGFLALCDVGVKYKNIPLLVAAFLFFWFSLKIPRAAAIQLVRPAFYYILPIYLIIKSKKAKFLK